MKHEMNTADTTILIVDDDSAILASLAALMKREGYRTLTAATTQDAADRLRKETVDLVISDLRIGAESGLELIRMVKKDSPGTETILLTAYGSIENAVEAMQSGAYDYITKPFSNDQLLLKVNKALERKAMSEELMNLRQQIAMSYGFDNIVGISRQIIQLKEKSRRIAPTDITVLITGPSGTGKELFARAIHFHSARRSNKLVTIDCSAIPETLLESELFGHRKGSFTSATHDKIGLFEEAAGGTVFLDEVSNMPQSVQVKLLRFLQNSEIRPVGASESKRVDVRIIAATNRDLGGMVTEKTFREDLYYRLNVIPLNLPALAERAEDIEILTDYFIRKICVEIGRPVLSIDRAAVERLRRHSWPGNVRELENTLKRGIALCNGGQLTTADIIFVSAETAEATPSVEPTRKSLEIKGRLLDTSQRTLIIKALNDNNWNYTRTAEELGIGRTTLWRKIKKYDLSRDRSTPETEYKQ